MIIDYIYNVVEAKHLDCPPFKIKFHRAKKHIPAFEDDATTHYVEFEDVHGILQKTCRLYCRIVRAHSVGQISNCQQL
jgi:hypothetical protein